MDFLPGHHWRGVRDRLRNPAPKGFNCHSTRAGTADVFALVTGGADFGRAKQLLGVAVT